MMLRGRSKCYFCFCRVVRLGKRRAREWGCDDDEGCAEEVVLRCEYGRAIVERKQG